MKRMVGKYYKFVLMISLERGVAHYKKFVDVLDNYSMCDDLKIHLKNEVY